MSDSSLPVRRTNAEEIENGIFKLIFRMKKKKSFISYSYLGV